jgi:asparagine synthase (glutamine-hydrolysing)
MCGFAGILGTGGARPRLPEQQLLRKMANRIAHRGPDDAAEFIDDNLGFAHRRLSIIDLTTGGQPMCSADGQVAIVFNGEIFNYIELRRDLQRQGTTFRTTSDTEVILELYRTHGIECVNRLNGQFSIALWDRRSKTLHLIRDRIGICPLFYAIEPGQVVFGSEIKALLPALQHKPSISINSLDQVFTFWAPLSPNSIFEGVREVSPGQIITVADGDLSESRYWDWPVPDGVYSTAAEDDLAGELHDLLVDATCIRLRSDVPVGAYLSGGLDSSAIVSLILNHTDNQLRTFSLTFDDEDFDESSFQATLVGHAKVEHSELRVGQSQILENLEKTVWHTETPILRTAPVPMGLLSGHVQDSNYKVVLTGEGADEVLGGYDLFKEAKVRQFWARQPDSELRPLLLKRLYPYLRLPAGKDAEYLKMFFGQGIDFPGDPGFSHIPRWTTTAKAKRFFSGEARSELADNPVETYLSSLPEAVRKTDGFNRAQFIESKTLMGAYLLCSQGDRMLMMNSVEGRFPFLDHRVIEFASTLPPALKMKVLNEKYLLKKAVGKYLPASILRRHKQPYRSPGIDAAWSGAGSSLAADCLSRESLQSAGLFDANKVSHLQRKAATRGRLSTSESQAITGILTTQLVHHHFCQ